MSGWSRPRCSTQGCSRRPRRRGRGSTTARCRTRRIAEVCGEHGDPLRVAALHYPIREAAVRCVVVGAGTPEQVRRNAEALAAEVPDDLWRRLRDEGLVAL